MSLIEQRVQFFASLHNLREFWVKNQALAELVEKTLCQKNWVSNREGWVFFRLYANAKTNPDFKRLR